MAKVSTKVSTNERVPLYVPYLDGDNGFENDEIIIGDNGRLYQIQRGTTVMVPPSVKEIYDRMERMKRDARENEKKFLDMTRAANEALK